MVYGRGFRGSRSGGMRLELREIQAERVGSGRPVLFRPGNETAEKKELRVLQDIENLPNSSERSFPPQAEGPPCSCPTMRWS